MMLQNSDWYIDILIGLGKLKNMAHKMHFLFSTSHLQEKFVRRLTEFKMLANNCSLLTLPLFVDIGTACLRSAGVNRSAEW